MSGGSLVPGAHELLAVQGPFAQRATLVRVHYIERAELLRPADDRQFALVHGRFGHAVFGDLGILIALWNVKVDEAFQSPQRWHGPGKRINDRAPPSPSWPSRSRSRSGLIWGASRGRPRGSRPWLDLVFSGSEARTRTPTRISARGLGARGVSGGSAVLAERGFDLLPLPRSEGDVILVEVRAPRQLLSIARHLSDAGGLTVLHVMHLVYAIFLDRGIVASATHDERSAVLRAVLDQTGASSALRALYAAMHLAAVPEPEAYREIRAIPRRSGDDSMKADLARATIAGDGGTSD